MEQVEHPPPEIYEHLLHVVMIGCIRFSYLLFVFFLPWSIISVSVSASCGVYGLIFIVLAQLYIALHLCIYPSICI